MTEAAESIRTFREHFTSPTFYGRLIGTAEYKLKEKRQRDSRKPAALPNEEDYTIHQQNAHYKEVGVQNQSDFIQLRRVVHILLSHHNARRGSEPARLQITDWEERESWIDTSKLQESDKVLLSRYAVTFVMGKGDSHVPVFFVRECRQAMDMLCDKDTRKMAGVSPDNLFIFAYTGLSYHGSIGYNEVRDVCEKQVKVPVITATKMRHRASNQILGP
jgi:hypothetical protein